MYPDNEHQRLLQTRRNQVKIYSILSVIAWIVTVILIFITGYNIAMETGAGFFLLLLNIIAVLAAAIWTGYKAAYAEDVKALEVSWEEYEALLERRREQRKQFDAQQEAIKQREREEQARKDAVQHLECPLCGSMNTRRISTLNRSVSVSAFGLASDKIGKQYECLNCKHKW